MQKCLALESADYTTAKLISKQLKAKDSYAGQKLINLG